MKFVIAPDSFKVSLTVKQAANVIVRGFAGFILAEYTLNPMTDGSEGTVAVLADATDDHFVRVPVYDPLDWITTASYSLLGY